MPKADADSPLTLFLQNGRQLPVHQCDCGNCRNEWYVPGISDDWKPRFCPFCGIEFKRMETGYIEGYKTDDPMDV